MGGEGQRTPEPKGERGEWAGLSAGAAGRPGAGRARLGGARRGGPWSRRPARQPRRACSRDQPARPLAQSSGRAKMAAEREPPPLGDGKPADFEEQEDGEDLFTSTVTTLEVRPRHRRRCAPSLISPSGAFSLHELVPAHPRPPTLLPSLPGLGREDACAGGPTSGTCQCAGVGGGG